MTTDDKLDKLLVDVTEVKMITSQHTTDLNELRQKLEPVFFHVTGLQWTMKVLGCLIGVVTVVATVIALWK